MVKSATTPKSFAPQAGERTLRRLVWLYAFLLVFEGALRKWVLPDFSDQLLLIRDPVVLISYVVAIRHGLFPVNRFIIVGLVLCVLMLCTTILFGHDNWVVMLYGLRVNILHFPFAFIIGKVFYRADVIQMGKYWLWATIPMTVLIALQFELPQSAWVNQAVGGGEGAGFSGGAGRYRPPATFSFTIGTSLFYTFSTAFLVAGLTQHKRYSRFLLVLSSIAILLSLPLSISRSLVLMASLTFIVGISCTATQKLALFRYARILLALVIGLFIASQIPIFDDAREAFLERWERSTGEDRGGMQRSIFLRTYRMFANPIFDNDLATPTGYGLGVGSNVGAKLMSGSRRFQLGESEWFRVIGESGLILGMLYLLWRVWLAGRLARISIRCLRIGNGLPIILLACNGFNVLIGQLGQATVYGFTILGIGLNIAAMRATPEKAGVESDDSDSEPNSDP